MHNPIGQKVHTRSLKTGVTHTYGGGVTHTYGIGLSHTCFEVVLCVHFVRNLLFFLCVEWARAIKRIILAKNFLM